MAQKRIRMVQRDILNDRLRLLYDDGTQGVLEYGGADISERKWPTIIKTKAAGHSGAEPVIRFRRPLPS